MFVYRSTIIEKDGGIYGPLQVLCSKNGWYIGRLFTSAESNVQEIGSRESEYYCNRLDAERALIRGEFSRHSEDLLRLYE